MASNALQMSAERLSQAAAESVENGEQVRDRVCELTLRAFHARRLDYDPSRGSFRGWLFTVTRNKLLDLREKQRRGQGAGGSSAQEVLDQLPAREDESLWDAEFRRHLFSVAAGQVKSEFEEKTWNAFWASAVDGKKPQEIAATLGITVGAVYIAKSRVQARLKERVGELTEIEYQG